MMHRATSPEAAGTSEVRCDCGRLLGRLVEGAFEIRCRRCRRLLVLSSRSQDGSGLKARAMEGGCQCSVEHDGSLEVEIVDHSTGKESIE
jgi:hypothetical protein